MGEAQGEGDGALLALAGEGRGGGPVEIEGEVVAVRTDHRLAQAPLLGGAGGEGGCEVFAARRLVAQTGRPRRAG